MDQQEFLSQTEEVRTAYLAIMAALSSADHDNSEEEIAFMEQMASVAGLSESSVEEVKEAMKNPSGLDLQAKLVNFKGNDLKFALVTDMLNLSYSDGELEAEEVNQIKQVNQILEISDEQYEALVKYVQEANKLAAEEEGTPEVDKDGNPKAERNNFLSSTGLENTFQKLNIPTKNFKSGSTITTALTSAAFYLVQSYMSGSQKNTQTSQQSGGGGLTGTLGSLLGAAMSGSGQSSGQSGNAMSGLGGLVSGFFANQSQKQGQTQGNAGALGNILSTVMNSASKGKGLGNLMEIVGGGKKKGGNASPLTNILGSLMQ